MPTKRRSTSSTKTSSKKINKKGVKAPKPGANKLNNPTFTMGLNLQDFGETPTRTEGMVKLLFADRTKPILAIDLVIVEGKIVEDTEATNKCAFNQNPYSSTYQRFKLGDIVEFIHVLRNDNVVEYVTTLKDCKVERIELRIAKEKAFESPGPTEQILLSFKEKVFDNEAKRLYNTIMGRK